MRRILSLTLFCFLFAFAAGGCSDYPGPGRKGQDDLQDAREFMRQRDFIEAEKSFERYLRHNPEGESRWEVWAKLVDIAQDIRHDTRSAQELLEAMLLEYENDAYRLRAIRERLGGEYERSRNYARAMTLYGELAADEGATALQRSAGYRGLSRIYLRRLEFSLAEESLKACLQLNLAPGLAARCRYELAGVYMVMEKTDESIAELRAVLDQGGADEALRVETVFNLADALEQKGDVKQAQAMFESILETYPNRKVIEARLEYFRKNGK